MSEAFNGVLLCQLPTEPSKASKWPFFGHSKKEKRKQGCGARVGAFEVFCMEPEPPQHLMLSGITSEAAISFPGPESEPLKILSVSYPCHWCGAWVGVAAFARNQNRSRQDIWLWAGVPAAADNFRTPESAADPESQKYLFRILQ